MTPTENPAPVTWDLEIKPRNRFFDLRYRELWAYRDLILLFVKRDFTAQYKQTLLGPLWHILQPLITTLMYTFIFGNFARIPTDGSPGPVFYLSGIIIWYFFAGCFSNTSNTFLSNAGIFGKIYFPRLAVPVSVVISNAVRFFIQLGIFLAIAAYYIYRGDISPGTTVALLPLLLIIMALMGMGAGLLVSSLTTKYRDLSFFLAFGLQLWMYLTPIIYPASLWGEYRWILDLNPMTAIVETFRNGFLGTGQVSYLNLGYSAVFSLVIFFLGTAIFNKVERTFMDTV
ncbi:MAG: ABC transporter permease [Bacteroidota bacterium]